MKQLINVDTNEIFFGELDAELLGVEGYPLRELTQLEIDSQQSIAAQESVNQDARAFLAETDWQILRHLDQMTLGVTTSLTQLEYEQLLIQRQEKRSLVN